MNTSNPNPNPNSNPQITPEKQQTAPEKQSPLNPNSPNKDSTSKVPGSEGDRQNQDKLDRIMKPQGNAVSAVVIAGILTISGMGFGALSTAHADPVTPPAVSEYCTQLADQFDKSLSLHNASEHLSEANRGRSLGWDQCTQGNSSQGEMTLKTAIRDLGVRPLVKDTPTRK
jgi:hypothetical protein